MKTKFILITSILAFILSSCKEKKVGELKNRISELESLNSKLTDSITRLNYEKIQFPQIIPISDKPILKVGKKETVKFIFHYQEELFEYDVYTTDSIGSPDELIYENLKNNEFEYEFTPTKTGEEIVELIAVFNIKNELFDEEIHIPIISGFATTE